MYLNENGNKFSIIDIEDYYYKALNHILQLNIVMMKPKILNYGCFKKMFDLNGKVTLISKHYYFVLI